MIYDVELDGDDPYYYPHPKDCTCDRCEAEARSDAEAAAEEEREASLGIRMAEQARWAYLEKMQREAGEPVNLTEDAMLQLERDMEHLDEKGYLTAEEREEAVLVQVLAPREV